MKEDIKFGLIRCITCRKALAADEFGVLRGNLNSTCKSCRRAIANRSYHNRKIVSLQAPARMPLLYENAEALRKTIEGHTQADLDMGVHFLTQSVNSDVAPPGLFSIVRKIWKVDEKSYSLVLVTLREGDTEWLLNLEYPIKRLAELITKFEKRLVPIPTKMSVEVDSGRYFCMSRGARPFHGPWNGLGLSADFLKEKFLEHGSLFSLAEDFQLPMRLVEYLSYSQNWLKEREQLLEKRYRQAKEWILEIKNLEAKLAGKSEPDFSK